MPCAEGADGGPEFAVTAAAGRRPAAPAIVHAVAAGTPQAISYADLELGSAALAQALLDRGLRRGDRLALRLPPSPAFVTLLAALLRAGIVAVPVSTRVPAASVAAQLRGIGCRRLVTAEVAPASGAGIETIDAGELASGAASRRGAAAPPFDASGDATIVFTSGSGGAPKAALHTYSAHAASAAGSNANLPFGPGDRWLLSLPLWHVGGLAILFRAFLGGGAVAVPAPGQALAAAILSLGATHLSLVATQLARLLRDPQGGVALAPLRAVLLGGGPAPPALVEEAVRRGVPLLTSYGSTELASTATATRPGDPAELLLTSGRPLPGREIAIAPDGEILARGATLFRGYLAEGGLDPARGGGGWYHTGDLGRIGADGCLRVDGRRDAMFISGGENIHPEEIERELARHPAVEEAMVVPVEDAEYGERPAAFVRSAGPLPPPEELSAFLRRTLPGFKVPAAFLPWPETEEGVKPLRRRLRELARGAPRGAGG